MNFSISPMYYPTSAAQADKPKPQSDSSFSEHTRQLQTPSEKKIDMRNISLNDINELIRSGIDGGLLDVMPINALKDANGNFLPNAGLGLNEKFDFMAQVENSIIFNKSIGKSTEVLEKILLKMDGIHGKAFPNAEA
ncbi:MAG: hypothetical protein Tsb002_03600 [Wenzhouxiangellaceae bacterium]